MRIALISYEFPPDTGKGGIGTYFHQLATMLGNYGWDVQVFAGSLQGNTTTLENQFVVHRVCCADAQQFKYSILPLFSKEQHACNFDLMESAEINANAAAIKEAFPDIPLIVRLHAPNVLVEQIKKKHISIKAKLRFVLGALRKGKWDLGYWRKYDYHKDADYQFTLLADGLVAPSNVMKSWAIDNWKLTHKTIQVIPNPFTASDALLNLPIPIHAPFQTVVFFGRLNALKGLVNACLAMKKILKEFPRQQFKVIGDDGPGPHHGISMKTWMVLQLSMFKDRVHFIEGVAYNQLPQLLAECEIALIPSLFESFSYTCAEAMSAGKAVIGSHNTGMADLIHNHIDGKLVNPKKVNELYQSLKLLIENNDMRYAMAQNARVSIQNRFSASHLAARYIELYKKWAIQN